MSQIPFASVAPQNHESYVYYMLNVYHFPFAKMQAQIKVIRLATWENRIRSWSWFDGYIFHGDYMSCTGNIFLILKKKPSII